MLDHIARGLVTACTRFDFNVLSDLPIAGEVRSTAAAEGVMAAASNRIHTFLVLKQPGQSDRIIVWDTQEISLGRSPENDISVDHAEISRQHANFVRTGKSCVVQNLNTSNGTLVNGQPVTTHTLQARDAICIAEVELTFYQSAKDPVALGMPISYASQLKQFEGPSMGSGDAEATMLGLLDTLPGPDEEFEVQSTDDFDMRRMAPAPAHTPTTRDLDLELEGFGLDDLDISDEMLPRPQQPAPSAAAPPQQREVWELQDWIGKVIELPALKIRIKDDDLG
jgi:pSer/pThr/pTyr-binding forkhead associated (FHA) protein